MILGGDKSFAPGEVVNGLTVISVAGRGGNGTVYLTRDATGKDFALKVLKSTSVEAELAAVTRYRGLVKSSAIVEIFNAGILPDGRLYYLMEAADNLRKNDGYLPRTLTNHLAQKGPLPPSEVLWLARVLLDGVAAIHAAGLAHLDLKPDNVIYCGGKPKISDFGLLNVDDGQIRHGTPGFVPADQLAAGQAIGENSLDFDLYALSKIIYCAATGNSADDYPDLPTDKVMERNGFMAVRDIYRKGCDKHAAYRYRDIDAFAKALRRAQDSLDYPHRRRKKFIKYAILGVCIVALAVWIGGGIHSAVKKHQLIRLELAILNAELQEKIATQNVNDMEALLKNTNPPSKIKAKAKDFLEGNREKLRIKKLCDEFANPQTSASRKKRLMKMIVAYQDKNYAIQIWYARKDMREVAEFARKELKPINFLSPLSYEVYQELGFRGTEIKIDPRNSLRHGEETPRAVAKKLAEDSINMFTIDCANFFKAMEDFEKHADSDTPVIPQD